MLCMWQIGQWGDVMMAWGGKDKRCLDMMGVREFLGLL